MSEGSNESRREFVGGVGRMAAAVTLGASLAPAPVGAEGTQRLNAPRASDWDLSWVDLVKRASDRAVFDWATLGTPEEQIVLQIAERFLNNCATVYGDQPYDARAVLNIRTQAVSAAFQDTLWERFTLGSEYSLNDPHTKAPALRNPFLRPAPPLASGIVLPSLADLLHRGSIALVCDFALGHLARRLATKAKRDQATVHNELRAGLVPGSYLMPSGIFGLAKAQNAGCAYVRM
jgi:hypothetical protein